MMEEIETTENHDDVESLVRQLERTQYEGMATLSELDPEVMVYADSGWKVKDIIAHLVAWDEPTVKCFQAYAEGGEYSIIGYQDVEDFNWSEYDKRYALPYTEIYALWNAARTRIKEIVATLSPEQLAGNMRYPSGNLGNCAQLVREVWEHQQMHFDDIMAALNQHHS
jgi:hypothetical protein